MLAVEFTLQHPASLDAQLTLEKAICVQPASVLFTVFFETSLL